MLQQILRDLYVNPEILAELDEQQKQTLFCKMREEQVRRWKLWDQKQSDLPPKPPRRSEKHKKSVSFLKGMDGEPWVWVMGEHKNDKTIEQILKEEAIEKARKLAEEEAQELRKQMEDSLSDYIPLTPKIEDLEPPPKLKYEDDVDIYCSVDELREKISNKPNNVNNYCLSHYQTKNKYNMLEPRDVLQEISLTTHQKVAQKVAMWEKRLTERTCEIFNRIQKKQMENAKEAEEAEKKQEVIWMEQERKAKQAELQIREIARRARAKHRLASGMESEYDSAADNSGVPPNREAVLEWYRNKEKRRNSGLDSFNNVEPWFHGLISRPEAETLLLGQPDGSFLVRLSEKIWGYAISYRSTEKCKHYLISAGQTYHFVGNNQIEHKTLGDLVLYHQEQPLSGGEKLQHPCPRESNVSLSEIIDDNPN